MLPRAQLRWNGWGRVGEGPGLDPRQQARLLAELERRFGRPLPQVPPAVGLDELRLPPPKLGAEVLEAFRGACGDLWVRSDPVERVRHSTGKSLPDLLRLRRGELRRVPDAVVYPGDEGAVAAVLRIASRAGLAVVPFGGGTSVVGGVEPLARPDQIGVVALDTTRLDALIRLDLDAGTATFGAGIDGPSLEAALRAHGLTLGHFPQSFEQSTLGGWIATRSSGQQSDGYGDIEDLVVALRVVTPEGVLRTAEVPRSAAGPDLNQLVLGSEGVLGVIVEATLRVRPRPAAATVRGALFRSFEQGVAAVRDLIREGAGLAMMRLADAPETELGATLRRGGASRLDPATLLLAAVRGLGYREERSLLLYAAEASDRRGLRRRVAQARAVLRRHRALGLGTRPGRAWVRDRFRTPYLRDWLLDHGVAVDTLETAVSWSRVGATHRSVLRALQAALESEAGAGLAMAHLSHSYRDGACLYFTLLYPIDPSRDIDQWWAIKRAGTDAILEAGGTLSHHHGVGSDHTPWIVREKGALGLEALRAAKQALDPHGVLNPGKLL